MSKQTVCTFPQTVGCYTALIKTDILAHAVIWEKLEETVLCELARLKEDRLPYTRKYIAMQIP